MDQCIYRGESCSMDIESCRSVNGEESSSLVACDIMEDSVRTETREYAVFPDNVQIVMETTSSKVGELVVEKKVENEKRKTLSAKKAPKPPRPPRGLSLDAADQKLIKELAELANLKRARVERMKASKKMKAAKSLSSSTSFSGLFALLCTVLFCVVIICQGMTSGRDNAIMGPHTSLVSSVESDNRFLVPGDQINPSASAKNSSDSLPPYLPELVSGSGSANYGEAAKS